VRTPSYAVPQERPLRAIALYRRPAAFMAVAAFTLALFAWNGWIMTTDDEERYVMLFPMLAIVVVIAVWISLWSFVSSAVGRRPNFAAHGFVACAGVIALVATAGFFEYLSFGLDAAWVDYIGIVAIAIILAYVVYRHLRLNSRATRRNLVLASTGISAGLCGAMAGLTFAIQLTQEGNQSYSDSIKAPAFLFVPGTSLETFMSDAEALKRKVDVMRKPDTKK
jgi:ABC-type sugar transport system permease subunit